MRNGLRMFASKGSRWAFWNVSTSITAYFNSKGWSTSRPYCRRNQAHILWYKRQSVMSVFIYDGRVKPWKTICLGQQLDWGRACVIFISLPSLFMSLKRTLINFDIKDSLNPLFSIHSWKKCKKIAFLIFYAYLWSAIDGFAFLLCSTKLSETLGMANLVRLMSPR